MPQPAASLRPNWLPNPGAGTTPRQGHGPPTNMGGTQGAWFYEDMDGVPFPIPYQNIGSLLNEVWVGIATTNLAGQG